MATTIEGARNDTGTRNPLVDLKKTISLRIPLLTQDAKNDLLELISAMLFCRDSKQISEMLGVMFEMLWPEQYVGALKDGAPDPEGGADALRNWKNFIGAKVRELRMEREWTQADLAKKTGLPQSHISRIELAKHSPSHVTIEKLAKALKVPVSKLDPSQ